MSTPKRKALLLSFIVYVAPISYFDFGSWTWVGVLVFPTLNDEFSMAVWSAYIVWTAIVQFLLFTGLSALFKVAKSRWAFIAVAAVLLFTVGIPLSLGAVYLDARVVPALYRQAEGPMIEWEEVCRVQHAHLLSPKAPRFTSLEGSGRAWMLSHADGHPALLTGCQVMTYTGIEEGTDADLGTLVPIDFDLSFEEHAGFRYRLFDSRAPSLLGKTSSDEHSYQLKPTSMLFQRQFQPGGCALYDFEKQTRMTIPHESSSRCPILSGDAELLASIEGTAYSVDGRSIELNRLDEQVIGRVDVSKIGVGFLSLQDISGDSERILLRRESSRLLGVRVPELESRRFSHEYIEAGFDGELTWSLPRRGRVEDSGILVNSSGWVAWQEDNDQGISCCTIEWRVGEIARTHRVARGREIVALSFHPSGGLIAVSVTDRHRTGQVGDAVYVLRSKDGIEVFRHYLPPGSESRVQFLGSDRLAYSDFDGADGFARIVKVPADGTAK